MESNLQVKSESTGSSNDSLNLGSMSAHSPLVFGIVGSLAGIMFLTAIAILCFRYCRMKNIDDEECQLSVKGSKTNVGWLGHHPLQRETVIEPKKIHVSRIKLNSAFMRSPSDSESDINVETDLTEVRVTETSTGPLCPIPRNLLFTNETIMPKKTEHEACGLQR